MRPSITATTYSTPAVPLRYVAAAAAAAAGKYVCGPVGGG
jgi:hypothetical protein